MSGNNLLNATSIAPQVLVSQQLGTSESAVYTVSANTSTKITQGTLCNNTGSPVTVYLSIIKNGGTMGDGTHRVLSGYSLAANDTLGLTGLIGGAMLGPNDSVSAYAGTAAAVDLVLTGTVHS